ncbi:MAG: DUF1749 domain-containing protein [Clostridia bacterium]|nr:DUF1749 domain-containing protein [Clostridia bacterium]
MIEKIYFELEDEVELVGLIHKPQEKTDEIVISIHGMQSNCLKKREDILAKNINNADIAYFAFNNRGTELMCYTKKIDGRKELNGGSIYEDVLESYYDIKGAIEKAVELGYKKIHLQGHSLGCTKIIYTYNRMRNENYEKLNYIKSIILLSLVDIVDCQKYDLGIDKYYEMLNWAEKKEKEGKQMELMPEGAFDHPISVKSYLRYFRDNEDIDFAKFSEKDYDFKELNNIKVPLFIRWGEKDLVIQKLTDLIEFLKTKINNSKFDISYIKKTDHGYTNKEKELAVEIIKFINNN